MENKLELLERLIKEEKITLKEALVLIGGNEEKAVTQRIPSQNLPDSYWKKPYEIHSKRDPFTTT